MRYRQWPKVLALAGWLGGSFSDDVASGTALDARRRGYRRRGAYEVPRAGRVWLALLAMTFCAAFIRRADGAVRQVVSVQTRAFFAGWLPARKLPKTFLWAGWFG